MKRTIIAILLLISSGYPLFEALGAERSPASKESGKTYVLIVGGINKDSKERPAKDRAVTDLSRFFIDVAGVIPEQLSVLVDSKSTARKRFGNFNGGELEGENG